MTDNKPKAKTQMTKKQALAKSLQENIKKRKQQLQSKSNKPK